MKLFSSARAATIPAAIAVAAATATACGDSPTKPSQTTTNAIHLEVWEGFSGTRTHTSLQNGFLPPPAITYTACYSLSNRSDITFSVVYEMEPLGPGGEVYPTVEFAPSPTTLAAKGGSDGCGPPTVNDFILTHPIAASYRLRIRYSAPGGLSGSVQGTGAIRVNFPIPPHVTVNEFRSRGPNGASDEFIELYNDSLTPATFNGRIFVSPFRSGSGGTISLPTMTIGSLCHFLITGPGYTGSVPGDMALPVALDDDGGLSFEGFAGNMQSDVVGMSSAVQFDTTPLANFGPENTDRSYARTGRDTNVNVNDFAIRSPSTPQNSSMCGAR